MTHYNNIKKHQSNQNLRSTTKNGTVHRQVQFYNNNRMSQDDTQYLTDIFVKTNSSGVSFFKETAFQARQDDIFFIFLE